MSGQRTKKRDRYESQVDDLPVRGVQAACHDLSSVLVFLGEFAKQKDLLDVDVEVGYCGETLYIRLRSLLAIAEQSFRTSISDACWVYQRLQQNEEAARLMAEALDTDSAGIEQKKSVLAWQQKAAALSLTLNDKAVVSRGFVSGARRVLARRASYAKASEENGGAA